MSNAEISELAPCPFCGGKVKPAEHVEKTFWDPAWFVSCNCGCSYGPEREKEHAERGWNNRAGHQIAGYEGSSGLYYSRLAAVANGEQSVEPVYRVKK